MLGSAAKDMAEGLHSVNVSEIWHLAQEQTENMYRTTYWPHEEKFNEILAACVFQKCMGMLRDFPFKMLYEVRVGVTASPTNGLEQCSKPWLVV